LDQIVHTRANPGVREGGSSFQSEKAKRGEKQNSRSQEREKVEKELMASVEVYHIREKDVPLKHSSAAEPKK